MRTPNGNCLVSAFLLIFVFAAFWLSYPLDGLVVRTFADQVKENGKILSENELLEALRKLHDDGLSLNAQLLGNAPSSLSRPDRKRMRFDEYRVSHQAWNEKITQGYDKLRECYAQVERTYRANPNSPFYKQIYQAYVRANEAFTKLNETFAAYASPETSQSELVIIADGRLERRLHSAELTKHEKSIPTHEPPVMISQSDEIRYIGRFDTIELYLCVKGQAASYVLSGLREQGSDAGGRTVDKVRKTVLVSASFPVSEIQALMPKQHLDQVLKLSLTPLGMQDEAWNFISDSLARARSYAKGN